MSISVISAGIESPRKSPIEARVEVAMRSSLLRPWVRVVNHHGGDFTQDNANASGLSYPLVPPALPGRTILARTKSEPGVQIPSPGGDLNPAIAELILSVDASSWNVSGRGATIMLWTIKNNSYQNPGNPLIGSASVDAKMKVAGPDCVGLITTHYNKFAIDETPPNSTIIEIAAPTTAHAVNLPEPGMELEFFPAIPRDQGSGNGSILCFWTTLINPIQLPPFPFVLRSAGTINMSGGI